MKKNLISLILALSLALSLIGCGGGGGTSSSSSGGTDTGSASGNTNTSSASGNTDAVTIKYSTTFPAAGTQADGVNLLGELISEHSDGRMTLEFYPSSVLGDKIASMEGLRSGTIEMTTSAATDLSSYSSIWSVFSLPYLWENGDQALAVLTDPSVSEVLNADAEANGFVIIAWNNAGSRSILNTKHAVNSPADLNGLRIRCMEDPVLAGAINAMGANATPLAWSECYTALQQGVIDGIENNAPTIYDNGMAEVAKYFSLTEHFTIPDPIFVSKIWFDGLSAENQTALLKAGELYTTEYSEVIWRGAEKDILTKMEAAGVQINEVDKSVFVFATQTVIDTFLTNADENQSALYELLMEVRKNY